MECWLFVSLIRLTNLERLSTTGFFENWRIFKKSNWVKQIYFLHILDHPVRNNILVTQKKRFLANPYLDGKDNVDSFTT